MKKFWDERYAEPEYVYGEEPNEFLKAFLDTYPEPPGRLLLPGEGEGRNAVYAARKGWEVVGFDQSRSGREKAVQLAARHGVSIRYDVCDVLDFPFEEASFDLIGLFFFHLPLELRRHTHQQVYQALKPGGTLIAELFSPRQIGRSSGGPQVRELLYDTEDLKQDFKDLNIRYLAEENVHLREGKYHEGEAAVVRLIAQKKLHS
ncbi:MAG: class I SAM-dependent methyltransferase [Lewinellaceae bacterium]|nr:class I SAM-dependent methyltransferase [Lewinellaceae bacterium]